MNENGTESARILPNKTECTPFSTVTNQSLVFINYSSLLANQTSESANQTSQSSNQTSQSANQTSKSANLICHSCCGPQGEQYCCSTVDDTDKVLIGILVGILLLLIVFLIYFVVQKRLRSCPYSVSENRFNVACVYNKKNSVKPMHKRTILKTANYTVDQSWDQMVVKFHSQRFFEAFRDALTSRYTQVTWSKGTHESEGGATCGSGEPVGLRILHNPRILIVTKEGNNSWVLNDFQNICKNLNISDDLDTNSNSAYPNPTPLQPRLPTIGEVIIDAGDYRVKASVTETEIKFKKPGAFARFKMALLIRYPDVTWNKFMERDCTQLEVGSSHTPLTVHLLASCHTLWVCGPGRHQWYHAEFFNLHKTNSQAKEQNTNSTNPYTQPEKESVATE